MVSYMYMYILLRREEDEEGVTSHSAVVKAESLACTINSTSSGIVASVQVKAWVKLATQQMSWRLISWTRPMQYLKRCSKVWLKGYTALLDCQAWIASKHTVHDVRKNQQPFLCSSNLSGKLGVLIAKHLSVRLVIVQVRRALVGP